jgi:hypothetical protein
MGTKILNEFKTKGSKNKEIEFFFILTASGKTKFILE